jgi:hypothetical protein
MLCLYLREGFQRHSAIKAEVFATVKVKKKTAASTPKPRTALLQEGENDMALSSEIIACESSSKDLNQKSCIC